MSKSCSCLLERHRQHRGHGQWRSPKAQRLPAPTFCCKFTAAEFDAAAGRRVRRYCVRLPRHGRRAAGGERVRADVHRPARPGSSGKNIGLFGSYGWGDGEWIRTWAEDAEAAGARLVVEPVMANGSPDGDAETACAALGTALANA